MKTILLILFSCQIWIAISQNRNNIWYFGTYAGIDFNSDPPQALIDGQIPMSEGCTSICDENGSLLFYSNGVNVWNKNHEIMPNGSGLMGSETMTQSVLAIPKPSTNNIYYLFTVEPTFGIHYSELDMNLQNGLGDINSSKNILIGNNTTEKLGGIRHQNGIDYWIITHQVYSDTFNVFLVNANGVNTNSIFSKVGPSWLDVSEVGYLKTSLDGTILTAALTFMDTVVIYDFNKSNGQITNPKILNGFLKYSAYGVEYSPSGQFLYVSDANDSISNLYQYDLTSFDIAATKTLIATLSGYTGALQLAPNGKIYITVANGKYLSEIANPNGAGQTCNFIENSFYLGNQDCFIGLPNYVNDSYNYLLELPELSKTEKYKTKIIDFLGREVKDDSDGLVIHIFNDGSTKKQFKQK